MKFHVTRQHDAMQCGAACLHTVCRHYGLNLNFDYVSNLCSTTRTGVSLLSLNAAAIKLGFKTICGKFRIDHLTKVQFPCILHWRQNHFVVLFDICGDNYIVGDPACGVLKLSKRDFSENWLSADDTNGDMRGVAMLLQPTTKFGTNSSDPHIVHAHTPRHSLSFLSSYIKPYRRYLFQVLLGLILGSIIQLVLPFMTQSIVDVGIGFSNVGFIWLVLIAQFVLIVSRASADFIRSWLLLHISMRVNLSLVSDFFIKLSFLPMSFFDSKMTGDIMQRINDHARVQDFLTDKAISLSFNLLTIIIFGAVLALYNLSVFAIFLVGSVIYGLFLLLFLKRRKVLDYASFDKQAKITDKTLQYVNAMPEIKLQDCVQRRRWEWEEVQADFFDVQMRCLTLKQQQDAGALLINEVKNILITVVAAQLVVDGAMSLGSLLAVQYIVGQLSSPIEQMLRFIHSWQDVSISLERINEIHDIKGENTDDCVSASHMNDSLGIEFSNVVFSYDPNRSQKTISNVSFLIPKGKVTAIVGQSGSGKTTLLKLILGYYPIASGSITLGGVSVSNINLTEWRRRCGVVMQDGVIFSESIARNIAASDEPISDQRVRQAAHLAALDTFVESLPLGFNTLIGPEGVSLSKGQQQRILIARAIYRQPHYVLFDEATNSLDAQNERVISDNLTDFYRGRTVLVIAHRLSTVRSADQIIVLDSGRVAEVGKHNQLIEKKGLYYNLVRNQLELGQ